MYINLLGDKKHGNLNKRIKYLETKTKLKVLDVTALRTPNYAPKFFYNSGKEFKGHKSNEWMIKNQNTPNITFHWNTQVQKNAKKSILK